MTTLESILVALFIIALVFSVLVALSLIIKFFSKILNFFTKEKDANEFDMQTLQNQSTSGPSEIIDKDFSAGELALTNVEEPTAALIMAIVSHESGIPLSELCFKSIKLIKENYGMFKK